MLLHLDTLLLCGFLVFAQAKFDPNAIDPSTKTQWCDSQLKTCELLCGGSSETLNNKCDSDSLKYTCLCNDEREPDVWSYEGTIPTLECEHESAGKCAAPKDASAGQSICQCGTLDPNGAKGITTTTSSDDGGTAGSGGLVLPTSFAAAPSALSGTTTLTTIVATLRVSPGSTTGTLSGLASATLGSTSSVSSAARATGESSSSIAVASAVGASSNPQTSPSPPPSNAPSSGLSSSAKIGIGLGVPLGILILAITAFLVFCFKTQRKLKANKAGLDQLKSHPEVFYDRPRGNDGEQGTQELHGTAQPTREMDAGPRLRGQGMTGIHRPGEIDTDSVTGERLIPWNRHEMSTMRADFARSAEA